MLQMLLRTSLEDFMPVSYLRFVVCKFFLANFNSYVNVFVGIYLL